MTEKIVLGFLGTTLDAQGGYSGKRHRSWRPSVSLCSHPELAFDRFELWSDLRSRKLAEQVEQDLGELQPTLKVRHQLTTIADPWDFEEVYGFLYDFAQNYPFNTEKEEYFVHLTTGTHVAQICLFLLCEARFIPAKLIQTSPPRNGASATYSIIDLNLEKYDSIAARFEKQFRTNIESLKSGIATKNSAFNRMIREIELVANSSKEPLLLMGPTGAGKSQLARRIFEVKKAQHKLVGSFVEINCATLRGDQSSSTLFGHIKGAFTGAVNARQGLLKRANLGVLFLDEIGELGVDEQALLLRAIEERRFLPVGSDQEEESEFQLIAGTNKKLTKLVAEGRFREDLLSRINTWTFELPSLAERREDIEPNLDYEIERHQSRNSKKISWNQRSKEEYLAFATSPAASWLGNFRDLNASVIRLATLAPGGRITSQIVRDEISRLTALWQRAETPNSSQSNIQELADPPLELDLFDQVQLEAVLSVVKRSRSIAEAGRQLFAVSRKSRSAPNDADRLKKYLGRFGIDGQLLLRR